MKIAFLGFRHPHIFNLYRLAKGRIDISIFGAAEDDAMARKQAAERGIVFTHPTVDALLAEGGYDAVAIGDYYGRRGELAIRALGKGLHVIADKPICTRLEELERIESLVTGTGRAVGCMLTFRSSGIVWALRDAISSGCIGEVLAVSFNGQHSLQYGTRPGWYFEENNHGGTLNDIAIHGIDAVSWVTGIPFASVLAARAWSTGRIGVPHFQDGAQFMATLANGAGIMGDVSYLLPEGQDTRFPFRWHFLFWGSKGVLELAKGCNRLLYYACGRSDGVVLPSLKARDDLYFDSFLAAAKGGRHPDGPSTEEVLSATRMALLIQAFADRRNKCVS